MKLIEKMKEVAQGLEGQGFSVLIPNTAEVSDYSTMGESEQHAHKNRMIIDHLDKIRRCDAILVVNDRLKEIDSYIGANSFLEIGFAFSLGKKIFLLNGLPAQPNVVEIGGMLPTCLKGDLSAVVL